MYDAVCIGDIFIDQFIKISDASLDCTLNQETCKLCLSYGDKIPVESLESHLGGSSSNVAVGLARLGLRTALVSAVGDDEDGKMALAALAGQGVVLDLVKRIPDERNNYSFILNYGGERTILGYHRAREYGFQDFEKSNWAYFAFSGRNFEPVLDQLVATVKKKKVLLGYNPSTYELMGGIEKLLHILAASHVLFVNKEEAQSLVSPSQSDKPENLVRKLAEFGPKIVVLTDGPQGAYAFDGEHVWFIESFPGKLVERTGTGDSFAAAFIAGLFYESDPRQGLRWGAANAASVIQKVGAQAGLLTKKELEQILSDNPDFQAREI